MAAPQTVAEWAAALARETDGAPALAAEFERQHLQKNKRAALEQELEAMPGMAAAKMWLDWARVAESGRDCEARSLAAAGVAQCWLSALAEQRKRLPPGAAAASRSVPAGLLRCCRALHDGLFEMEEGGALQRRVARVCEQWWVLELDGREQLVARALPVLLVAALEETAKKADVRRVIAVRGMLQVLDLEDDSSVALRHLLLRCFLSPHFLAGEDGARFLSELCWLSEDMPAEVHATVMGQLPFAARDAKEDADALLERYAEVYFRAWRGAAEGEAPAALLASVERDMVQDAMARAVEVADPALARAMLHFLNRGFHDRKHVRGVDAMLLRLYTPILWRALSAANPQARLHAARLLGRAFPLQDPEAPVAQADEALQRQFAAAEALLRDACPRVRVAGVQFAARMLSVYWELLPRRATAALLSALVGDLLHDAASAEVRAAVLAGLEFVSENPLSLRALTEVLPHVAPLIHDEARPVRAALLSLLLRVKRVRAVRFFDVVPADHLLERLAVDRAMAPRLTLLLLESFFPQEGVSGGEQLARALALLEGHPHAAAAFFSHVHRHVSVGATCKLALLLGRWVQSEVERLAHGAGEPHKRATKPSSKRSTKNSTKRSTRTSTKRGKAEAETDAEAVAEADADVDSDQNGAPRAADGSSMLAGALCAIAALWRSVAPQLQSQRYRSARQQMLDSFGFDAFVRPMALSGLLAADLPPLLEIAGRLPCDAAFLRDVAAELPAFCPAPSYAAYRAGEALPAGFMSALSRRLGPVLECLSMWGQHPLLLGALRRALEEEEEGDGGNGGAHGAAKARKTAKRGPAKGTAKKGASKGASNGAEDALSGARMNRLVAMGCLQYLLANDPGAFREAAFRDGACGGVQAALAALAAEGDALALETQAKLLLHRLAFEARSRAHLLDEGAATKSAASRRTAPRNADGALSAPLRELVQSCAAQCLAGAKGRSEGGRKRSAAAVAGGEANAQRLSAVALVALSECAALGLCAEDFGGLALGPIAARLPAALRRSPAFRERFGAFYGDGDDKENADDATAPGAGAARDHEAADELRAY